MFKKIIKPGFTLGKTERLKSRKLIGTIFSEGRAIWCPPLRINWIIPPTPAAPLQAGFTVSKKNFKRAVDRNRIRRLMKEAYRMQKKTVHSILADNNKHLAIFFIYTGAAIPAFEEVQAAMLSAIERLKKIADEIVAADH